MAKITRKCAEENIKEIEQRTNPNRTRTCKESYDKGYRAGVTVGVMDAIARILEGRLFRDSRKRLSDFNDSLGHVRELLNGVEDEVDDLFPDR